MDYNGGKKVEELNSLFENIIEEEKEKNKKKHKHKKKKKTKKKNKIQRITAYASYEENKSIESKEEKKTIKKLNKYNKKLVSDLEDNYKSDYEKKEPITEGSIIRNKEKTEYVSLLELVKKYQELEKRKQASKEPIVLEDSDTFSKLYIKK